MQQAYRSNSTLSVIVAYSLAITSSPYSLCIPINAYKSTFSRASVFYANGLQLYSHHRQTSFTLNMFSVYFVVSQQNENASHCIITWNLDFLDVFWSVVVDQNVDYDRLAVIVFLSTCYSSLTSGRLTVTSLWASTDSSDEIRRCLSTIKVVRILTIYSISHDPQLVRSCSSTC